MLGRLLFLAVPAAVLVSAQSRPNPGPILGCTTSSFQIPSWLIQDVDFSNGKISFQVLNRATNFTGDATCEIGSTGWSACSVEVNIADSNETIQMTAKVKGKSAQVFINQTWTCSDRAGIASPLPFVAIGNSTVPLECTGASPSVLVKASLLSPVVATPDLYNKGPEGHNRKECASETPSWTLEAISYLNQTGNGASTATFENFNMVITNDATGYQASCMLGRDTSDGPLRCSGSEFGRLKPDRYTVETEALFDRHTYKFTMNQTWYCDDSDPAKPISITAGGSTTLPLKCATETTLDTTSETCRVENDSNVPLKGETVSQTALPAYSIIDPVLGPDGCTASSILHPQWTFNYFHIDQTKDNSSSVGFNIILQTPKPGFGFPLSISQDTKPLANDSSWYTCVIGPYDPYEERLYPTECSLRYNPARKELTIKADWVCSDLDANNPIKFSGISTASINTSLVCDTTEDGTQCITEDPAYSFSSAISDVTWSRTP
ncbi:hypothetical protein B0H66DRAFT_494379 [Apodospora peruviana]|uniref:Uncharacterized protein n=1 Tax=Apodospora peruviana TaxID=516989 RepID=A0AAE0IBB2_9PEZI|nr:hypothetical protein B0H66DRAFT_494379 [Apodospora peruviana]